MSLKGKVALITGGGDNLGEERARQLARQGANLALQYNPPAGHEMTLSFREEMIRQYSNINISVHAADLSTIIAVEKLFSEVLAEHGKIDIIVNTAGMVLEKPVSDTSEVGYDKMFVYAVFVDEQRMQSVDRFHAEFIRGQHR